MHKCVNLQTLKSEAREDPTKHNNVILLQVRDTTTKGKKITYIETYVSSYLPQNLVEIFIHIPINLSLVELRVGSKHILPHPKKTDSNFSLKLLLGATATRPLLFSSIVQKYRENRKLLFK